jgi:3-methyladenine DNA glycosylase Tag
VKTFDEMYDEAVARHGEDELEARFHLPRAPGELAATTDDRWLSSIAKVVFAAGFRWSVVQAKWDGFEEAFYGFDPASIAEWDEDMVEALVQDTRIIRNGQKIRSTIENAAFVSKISAEHGGFGQWVADWDADDVVGLWEYLKKNASRLGGASGPRVLRAMGKDTFILTGDVAGNLTEQGILTGKPTSKRQMKLAQDAFVEWRNASGRSFAEISAVLACSFGEVYHWND